MWSQQILLNNLTKNNNTDRLTYNLENISFDVLLSQPNMNCFHLQNFQTPQRYSGVEKME